MFSIIVPLYNKAEYIEKAIDSVLAQTFQDFELIIVNDGSIDNSLEKLKKYNDSRIKIISQNNSGVSTARNNGVASAKYEFVAFLDADDWWDANFLAEMKLLIENYSEAAIFGCNYFYVKNGKSRVDYKGLGNDFLAGYIDYMDIYSKSFCVPFNCSFVVVRKSVFQKMGGFKFKLKFGEDFDLWIRIALQYKIAYLNKPLAYSNQDVIIKNRALGGNKIWKKEEHFIFNLNYLEGEERKNSKLKFLIDGLKLRSLIYFYLRGEYKNEVAEILQSIDFKNQAKKYDRIYHYPKFLVVGYFYTMKFFSSIKKAINGYI